MARAKKAKPKPTASTAKYNNRLPEYDRYYSGRYEDIWKEFQKGGQSLSQIGKKFGVTKARVQQIVARRRELDKMSKVRREMRKLSPQAVLALEQYFGRPDVTRASVRKLKLEHIVKIPRVGTKMAEEIVFWAHSAK